MKGAIFLAVIAINVYAVYTGLEYKECMRDYQAVAVLCSAHGGNYFKKSTVFMLTN